MGQHQDGLRLHAAVTSALIGLAFLGEIKFIREGTILNAILVGQYIRLYFFLYKKMSAKKDVAETGKLETVAS